MNHKELKGFSLLEVLITILLTAVGILGVVAMQSRSIQYTQDSVERNIAMTLSEQLIGIMRSTPCAIYERVPPFMPIADGLKSTSLFYGATASGGCNGDPAATATATTLRNAWIQQLQDSLPGATYSVCRSSKPETCDNKGSMLEIRISWQGRDSYCIGQCDFYTRVEI